MPSQNPMQQALAPQATAPVAAIVEVPVEESKYITIKSQSLELYRKPSPDKPMFVEVKHHAKGDVLCVIAMKLFNEIEFKIAIEILVDDMSL
jgi:acetyl-CoA carboxylase biotin carboxyl carrier protein